ncbi:hypothetical protein [Streptomyces sp. V1I1]|uniref:hypothetical protein n=1 Tax=Streptomyces sp. V1I1 TaxID=3042272 RepID=UPI0027850218|nr:hypothetical protein [Streptomyces sp. V1I1]MDQ0938721.1 cyanophycinase-like exopeptidase [Streptomyces sp. V1I1]
MTMTKDWGHSAGNGLTPVKLWASSAIRVRGGNPARLLSDLADTAVLQLLRQRLNDDLHA